MMKLTRMHTLAFVLALTVASILPLTGAWAEKGDLSAKAKDPMISIMLGKAEMVDLKGNVSDVLVANPSIVDVMAVKANKLYLVGSNLGDTNIMIMDEDGNVLQKLNVHVQMDTQKLSDMVDELYPDEEVHIKTLTDQVVLTGSVSTPGVANSIMNLVGQYAAEIQEISNRPIDQIVVNMLKVQGEDQVMLKVRIIEASRSALKDLGLETNVSDGGSLGAVAGAITSAAGLGLSAPAQLGVLALTYDTGGFGPLNFFARALEEEGILNTLAEPNLTAISGEQAGFLAGGEIPIPTQLDRNGNLVYEFRPFGVSLNFRPTVISKDRISMEMTTEVSSTSFDQNLQLQGLNVPSFNVRRAQTTVELPSGGTLMIAGLLQSDAVSKLTGIPGVRDVPIVGDLLKSDSFQRQESEVVVMITPYLVRPFAQNQTIPPVPHNPEPVKNAPAKPVDTSDAADMNAIPRLSLADLGETTTSTDNKSFAMAPPAGLSQEKMLAETPLAAKKAEPERDKNALTRVFESNINRTYNSKKAENVMKDMGGFGYMMD